VTDRGWTLARASLLVMATVLLSPLSPVWIVFVPFALLLLAFRTEDWMSVALAALILGLGFAGSRPGGMEWYVPRAWSLIAGGAFVVVNVAKRGNGLVNRSLAAIGVALGVVALIGVARPGVLQGVNWWMGSEIRHAAVVAGSILEQIQGGADPDIMLVLAEQLPETYPNTTFVYHDPQSSFELTSVYETTVENADAVILGYDS